jgi:hypothetical protein
MTTEPEHLNSHQRHTLLQILQHPVGHNIEWRSILLLLDAVGSVEEHREGRFLVTIGAETETFDRPKGKDIEVQQVVDLRRMLKNAGYETKIQSDDAGDMNS